ncbi:MAG: NAD(P)-dependent oxidoreductase [Ectothiorhodospiraceae bacterium]|nr:NAD(P)-dependent oxidoreductase [Ectothiorhodospiraceae bacterium]
MSEIGFIGLGNMGLPMATNLARAGTRLVTFDAAGPERAPPGARALGSTAEVAAAVETVLLCLPDGKIVHSVARELIAASPRKVKLVVDHSTIGIEAAREASAMLAEAGIEYVDAPVSGGVAGARNATIAVMCAGNAATVEGLRPLLGGLARNIFHVGDDPGQGQALKVLNNFLSATAMAATSEAVAFGVSVGLDMKTILDVVNVSSGQNTATAEKFPNRVLTEKYDAGFTSRLMLKDVRLYREALAKAGGQGPVSRTVEAMWAAIEAAEPGTDITRLYPFVRDGRIEEGSS